jgi:zinc protease
MVDYLRRGTLESPGGEQPEKFVRKRQMQSVIAATWIMLLACGHAAAEIDLQNATVERLDNGMTVILLEDRNFPVASTQMLYRVGARDESYGQTGIAHFVEHMAFRSSENFPDTGLVSSIYAIGGEWHGYTWTDQTTYFATVPKEHLDLLLRIEADRMTRLCISPDDMEAERGAVLAEMHMYENYPTSMLLDAVMFTSFLGHPYRNNTIGWESDIVNLKHEEVVAFYARHYQPANAVLAVVGDIDSRKVRARIRTLFGEVKGGEPTPLPRTVEPIQKGERRVRLYGETDVKRFMVGWRAPSANHPDFAAFLVLQEVLGSGSGVNFRQNDWGTPVREDALLHGIADELTTWYPPSAQDYIFIVGGTVALEDDESVLEQSIEDRLADIRRRAPDDDAIAAAVLRVHDELAYDVETTEDAAHQLAFFDGLQALESFLALPERVARVRPDDVQRVARTWLLPERRSIAWHMPDPPADGPTDPVTYPEAAVAPQTASSVDAVPVAAPAPPDTQPVPLPEIRELRGGIPAIVLESDVSRSAYLQVVLPGSNIAAEDIRRNNPVLGHSSLAYRFRPADLQDTVTRAREAVDSARVEPAPKVSGSADPETVIEQVFVTRMLGERRGNARVAPALIVVSGDVDRERMFEALEESFGDLPVSAATGTRTLSAEGGEVEVRLNREIAQAQLGYIVPAPAPADEGSLAYRILLYILSHDYEGRLGREAISNRGLAYYIDSRYRSDGRNGWITVAVGVDPGKLPDLKALLASELERLRDAPPTIEEIEEAKRHFLGRARSAAQSNQELSQLIAEHWLWYGDTVTPKTLDRMLGSVSSKDVLDAVPAFIEGVTIVVDR